MRNRRFSDSPSDSDNVWFMDSYNQTSEKSQKYEKNLLHGDKDKERMKEIKGKRWYFDLQYGKSSIQFAIS